MKIVFFCFSLFCALTLFIHQVDAVECACSSGFISCRSVLAEKVEYQWCDAFANADSFRTNVGNTSWNGTQYCCGTYAHCCQTNIVAVLGFGAVLFVVVCGVVLRVGVMCNACPPGCSAPWLLQRKKKNSMRTNLEESHLCQQFGLYGTPFDRQRRTRAMTIATVMTFSILILLIQAIASHSGAAQGAPYTAWSVLEGKMDLNNSVSASMFVGLWGVHVCVHDLGTWHSGVCNGTAWIASNCHDAFAFDSSGSSGLCHHCGDAGDVAFVFVVMACGCWVIALIQSIRRLTELGDLNCTKGYVTLSTFTGFVCTLTAISIHANQCSSRLPTAITLSALLFNDAFASTTHHPSYQLHFSGMTKSMGNGAICLITSLLLQLPCIAAHVFVQTPLERQKPGYKMLDVNVQLSKGLQWGIKRAVLKEAL